MKLEICPQSSKVETFTNNLMVHDRPASYRCNRICPLALRHNSEKPCFFDPVFATTAPGAASRN
jgi:hypothetical protein